MANASSSASSSGHMPPVSDLLMPNPIEAHGVIGDQRTAALVARDGSIDFMCWPNFDSPTIFASLLDQTKGGSFEITPKMAEAHRKQLYLPDTNVLMTRFSSPEGTVEIVDFMPVTDGKSPPKLVRRVTVTRGSIDFYARCAPRFDYARAATAATKDGAAIIFRSETNRNAPALRLMSCRALAPVTMNGEGSAEARFTLKAGETANFALFDASEPVPTPEDCKGEFETCLAYWHQWVAKMKYKGRWREMVTRSALALKLMTSRLHGSVTAAVTFGLPEALGSERNWDYRGTWIRDASFTVYAFMRLGYVDEANAFMHWIEDRTKDQNYDGSLQIMYGIDGETTPDEETLDYFSGYGGSEPVRIGNAAHKQVQLDIYGELMDAIYLANKYGEAISHDGWQNIIKTVDYVGKHWREPDQGIWETRDAPRHWLHSRLMCWVAVDRAARLALKKSLPAPLTLWHELRDEIYNSIWQDFWNESLGHFVAFQGGETLDAAMLMMPLVRFISATDPKWLATMEAIGKELVDDPLVYRHKSKDGLNGAEGAFTPCSFWYAECLARSGRLSEARLMFEKMLGFANEVGLYSEEIGFLGQHLGNTPQAFTHLALISAAYYIDRELSA